MKMPPMPPMPEMPKVVMQAKEEVKAECKPLGAAALYVLCCVAWICLLPVVVVGAMLKDMIQKLKPAKPEDKPAE